MINTLKQMKHHAVFIKASQANKNRQIQFELIHH
jgi:hypothetical protein